MGAKALINSHPKKFGKGGRRCRVCGNQQAIIRKYNMNICRQCFRTYADDRLREAQPGLVVKKCTPYPLLSASPSPTTWRLGATSAWRTLGTTACRNPGGPPGARLMDPEAAPGEAAGRVDGVGAGPWRPYGAW